MYIITTSKSNKLIKAGVHVQKVADCKQLCNYFEIF